MKSLKQWGLERMIDGCLYKFDSCSSEKPDIALIFFHSLELDEAVYRTCTHESLKTSILVNTWTFEDDSTRFWPGESFKEDENLSSLNPPINVKAYAAAYDCYKYKTATSGLMDRYLIGENLRASVVEHVIKDLSIAGKAVPIVMVGHGFGGIILQELLLQVFEVHVHKRDPYMASKTFLENLAGIVFYATPFGTFKDDVFKAVFQERNGRQTSETGVDLTELNTLISRLQNDFLMMLRKVTQDLRRGEPIELIGIHEGAETRLGSGKYMEIVKEASSSLMLQDKKFTVPGVDHFQVCRPRKGSFTEDFRYTFLRDLIARVVKRSETPASLDSPSDFAV